MTEPDAVELELIAGRPNYPVEALRAAVASINACCGRWEELARCLPGQDVGAAARVTAVADVYLRWLKRPATIALTLVEGGDYRPPGSLPGGHMGTTISDGGPGSVARYVIDAADAAGFPVDASLAVSATGPDGSPSANLTAEIIEATAGTASGKDELVVRGMAPGDSTLVKVYDPAQADTVFGSDSVDVTTGGVATITLSAPTIEDAPAAPAPGGDGGEAPAPEGAADAGAGE